MQGNLLVFELKEPLRLGPWNLKIWLINSFHEEQFGELGAFFTILCFGFTPLQLQAELPLVD